MTRAQRADNECLRAVRASVVDADDRRRRRRSLPNEGLPPMMMIILIVVAGACTPCAVQ